jgi:hypothetical protein
LVFLIFLYRTCRKTLNGDALGREVKVIDRFHDRMFSLRPAQRTPRSSSGEFNGPEYYRGCQTPSGGETGTFKGGGALFRASIPQLVNPKGKVITVDIMPQMEQAAKRDLFFH